MKKTGPLVALGTALVVAAPAARAADLARTENRLSAAILVKY